MEISDVRIRSVSREEDKLKAFVSITVDNALVIHNLKVIEGKKGMFVAMPSKKMKRGDFKDIVHPINNETRKMIEDTILTEYYREVEKIKPEDPPARKDTKHDANPESRNSTENSKPGTEKGNNNDGLFGMFK